MTSPTDAEIIARVEFFEAKLHYTRGLFINTLLTTYGGNEGDFTKAVDAHTADLRHLISLARSTGELRAALEHFACGCEGECERIGHPDDQDDACFARLALKEPR